MWDLPGPGLEPVSPALAGGFLTTAPPGKPPNLTFLYTTTHHFLQSGNDTSCILEVGGVTFDSEKGTSVSFQV